ncbi:MAG: hypothetical protein AABW90_03055 [Nanoarchaeota archaeon]|mgnify:CR=1 FL=1
MKKEIDNSRRIEIYNPIKQPVSYAILYGFVPELREPLRQYSYNFIKAEKRMRDYELK